MNVTTPLPVIAILGYGTMGKTLASGLLKSGVATRDTLRIGVRRPHPQGIAPKDDGLGLTTLINADAARLASTLVLCVKPRDVEALLARLREAGVQVETGLFQAEAVALNAGFSRRVRPAGREVRIGLGGGKGAPGDP